MAKGLSEAQTFRRLSSHKTSMVYGIAASIQNIAEMRDGSLHDANMRLVVIESDAKRIMALIDAGRALLENKEE